MKMKGSGLAAMPVLEVDSGRDAVPVAVIIAVATAICMRRPCPDVAAGRNLVVELRRPEYLAGLCRILLGECRAAAGRDEDMDVDQAFVVPGMIARVSPGRRFPIRSRSLRGRSTAAGSRRHRRVATAPRAARSGTPFASRSSRRRTGRGSRPRRHRSSPAY
jgi:hypothetical protein